MAERLLPGLIQDAFVSLKAKEFAIRDGMRDGTCALYRLSPTGYVWIADLASRELACDLAAFLLDQHDIRPK